MPIPSTRWLLCATLVALSAMLPAQRPLRAACMPIHDVTALAPASGGMLLAGTREGGIYRGEGRGCWAALASPPGKIEIGTLLVVPGAHPAILAGTSWLISTRPSSGFLYRSADAGTTWTPVTVGMPATPIIPLSIAVARSGILVASYVCPADQQQVARKLLCPQGLARSTDGGRSWRPVGPPMTYAHGVIALGDGSLLAAGVAGRAGSGRLYAASDGGRTWRDAGTFASDGLGSSGANLGGLVALYAIPWEPRGVLGIGDVRYFRPRVYRSRDGGAHWAIGSPEQLGFGRADALIAVIGLAPSRTMLVSILSATSPHTLVIYRSRNEGSTWLRTGSGMPPNERVWALLARSNGTTVYAATNDGVYRSDDAGSTWRMVGD